MAQGSPTVSFGSIATGTTTGVTLDFIVGNLNA
jgi:hypothetical protein